MVWKVEIDRSAERQIEKLGSQEQQRIRAYLADLELLDDPRLRGKGLTANRSGYWCYRVGDYRILCDIRDSQLIVLVVSVEHRSTAYRR